MVLSTLPSYFLLFRGWWAKIQAWLGFHSGINLSPKVIQVPFPFEPSLLGVLYCLFRFSITMLIFSALCGNKLLSHFALLVLLCKIFGDLGSHVEELEQLERMEKASTSCKEMLSNVETRPDPLLPSTVGPVNPAWDRWFEGPHQDSKGCCRCSIL
ncbi:uncharacterized protein LOC130718941 isoform X1 [Lotus japonicus]|uniref:uncharacterized protein LOC130718941 isoform X1 n=1 Tax=Lotus japonicus TaxID=34305 RepID=UPI00258668F2|nr:uncharacterized protein LOC130718941 isoform X1 [Lotus japonicus]